MMQGANVFAPVLDQVAARIAGSHPCWRTDSTRWAYCLREAVGLVRPDWVITHFDPFAEADAVTASVTASAAVVDVDLARTPILAAALELTTVLARLYPGQPVAASVTGPGTLSKILAQRFSTPDEDLPDLIADVGDLLGVLVGSYVAAGAGRILVWESFESDLPDDVADSHGPMLRRLDTMGVPAVLCGAEGLDELGYAHHVVAGRGLAVAADFGTVAFDQLWPTLVTGYDGPIVSDGPIPGDADLSVLAAAANRC
ncbi:hypothetical protein [[Mycobacterium] burgundiense]|uniref:Uroporphyrinogen decarboxylase (URO-D) domain-containing protein n=1 Tax=[Mycobacterium] burgundiense TaxID=3064286 RepID=A0ABN9NIB2_9MYCO|nr:hypothetical protein [Mycolicibacterium sp. MU0053]CAJ1504963.1 hypothetical protein MU0053_002816 [Mycolicibacterium sp. MU0053]